MMYTSARRNIKKRTTDTDSQKVSPFIIKRSPTSKFKFPYEEDVPSGLYISKIIQIVESKTRKNESSFDVCYELVDYHYCYRRVNKLQVDDKKSTHYFIRLRYPINSEYADEFVEAMYNAGVCEDELDPKDAVGVTEHIKLIYEHDDSIGTIIARVPCNRRALKEKYQQKLREEQLYRDPNYGDGYL